MYELENAFIHVFKKSCEKDVRIFKLRSLNIIAGTNCARNKSKSYLGFGGVRDTIGFQFPKQIFQYAKERTE